MKFEYKTGGRGEVEVKNGWHSSFLSELYHTLTLGRDFDELFGVIETDIRSKPLSKQRWFRRDSMAQNTSRVSLSVSLSSILVSITNSVVSLKQAKKGNRYFFAKSIEALLQIDIYEGERFQGRLSSNATEVSCLFYSIANILQVIFSRVASTTQDFPGKDNAFELLLLFEKALDNLKRIIPKEEVELSSTIDVIKKRIIPELRVYIQVRHGNTSFTDAIDKTSRRFEGFTAELLIELASLSQIKNSDADSDVAYYREAGDRLLRESEFLIDTSEETALVIFKRQFVLANLAPSKDKFSHKRTAKIKLRSLKKNTLSDYIFRFFRGESFRKQGLEGGDLENSIHEASACFWAGDKHSDSGEKRQVCHKLLDKRLAVELCRLSNAMNKNLVAIRKATRDLGVIWWTVEFDNLIKSLKQLKEAYERVSDLMGRVLLINSFEDLIFIKAISERWAKLKEKLRSVEFDALERSAGQIKNVDISLRDRLIEFRQTCNELSKVLGKTEDLVVVEENSDEEDAYYTLLRDSLLTSSLDSSVKLDLLQYWRRTFGLHSRSVKAVKRFFCEHIEAHFSNTMEIKEVLRSFFETLDVASKKEISLETDTLLIDNAETQFPERQAVGVGKSSLGDNEVVGFREHGKNAIANFSGERTLSFYGQQWFNEEVHSLIYDSGNLDLETKLHKYEVLFSILDKKILDEKQFELFTQLSTLLKNFLSGSIRKEQLKKELLPFSKYASSLRDSMSFNLPTFCLQTIYFKLDAIDSDNNQDISSQDRLAAGTAANKVVVSDVNGANSDEDSAAGLSLDGADASSEITQTVSLPSLNQLQRQENGASSGSCGADANIPNIITSSSAQPFAFRRKSTGDFPTNTTTLPPITIPKTTVIDVGTNTEDNHDGAHGSARADVIVDQVSSEITVNQYIEKRFNNIRSDITESQGTESLEVSNFCNSCDELKQSLLNQASRLRVGSDLIISISSESEHDLSLSDDENMKEKLAFKEYVTTVLPERRSPTDSFIAVPRTIDIANRKYVEVQPSIYKKEKAKRLGILAAKVVATALLIGGGAGLCIISAGVVVPVVAPAIISSIGITWAASLGSVASLGGIGMGIYSFFSTKDKGFDSEEKKQTRLMGDEVLSVSQAIYRCRG